MTPLRGVLGREGSEQFLAYCRKVAVIAAAVVPLLALLVWFHSVTVMGPVRESFVAGRTHSDSLARAFALEVSATNKRLEQIKLGQDVLIEIGTDGVYNKPEVNRMVQRLNVRLAVIESDIDAIEAKLLRARLR